MFIFREPARNPASLGSVVLLGGVICCGAFNLVGRLLPNRPHLSDIQVLATWVFLALASSLLTLSNADALADMQRSIFYSWLEFRLVLNSFF
jgi:hypothetical protein